ncbi:peroxidase-like [Mizuhopecten yessoensis]|uniref:Myeloperoxidase n=1 Tax=Mizuhopecten yessoensis TaxID=6573 RepID=A0A210PSL9_MIZYE|nr:peroxidase-like [Mizuhopecten yessoensis]OWF39452.1 Myeloperoxidase [Mizuhopecten yessoensis]
MEAFCRGLLVAIVVTCILSPIKPVGASKNKGKKLPTEEEIHFTELIQNAIEYAEKAWAEDTLKKSESYKHGVDTKNQRSSDGQLSLFADEDPKGERLEELAYISLEATKKLERSSNVSISTIRSSKTWLKIWKTLIHAYCDKTKITCDPNALYRSANGSCNNLHHPTWGMAFTPQLRFLPPTYDDWIDLPRTKCHSGRTLPSARKISNTMFCEHDKLRIAKNHTIMVMAWGQFIDHDVIFTPLFKGANGSAISCCDKDSDQTRPECFPIEIPGDDPHFKNKTCMNFVRSTASPSHSCLPAPREQLNQVTSYIDASTVYGSSEKETKSLRTMKKGKLLTSKGGLPPAGKEKSCVLQHPKEYCFRAGDKRVNVVPNLSATHILFINEHNRIAKKLARLNRHWTDEITFQETRKIIIALMQHITYREYLPKTLNADHMSHYGLNYYPGNYNNVYDPSKNTGTRNSFAAAAFRYGHSQIPPTQSVLAEDHITYKHYPLEETYHKPFLTQEDKGKNVAGLLRWLSTEPTTCNDRVFEPQVRDLLFLDKKGNSFDLPAINIQRGRDHGMPCYNEWREWCNLPVAKSFEVREGGLVDHDPVCAGLLKKAYGHVNDIDLYAGAISEQHIPNGEVGPTFACIIARQFHAYKYGDRFWYEQVDKPTAFTRAQLKQIKKITLSKISCDNFKIRKIQKDSFTTISPSNPLTDCKTLPKLKLRPWKETIAQTKKKHGSNY